MKFPLGHVVATPAAIELCERFEVSIHDYVRRHEAGDWGDLTQHDKDANEDAVLCGARILSCYKLERHKLWILTDATNEKGERFSTTCMIPSDY